MSPAPPNVRLCVPVIISPEARSNVSVPESELIRVAAARVIAPAKVLLFCLFKRAPAELTPVPERFSGSAAVVMVPCISKAAPLETVVPVPVPPNALAWRMDIAPPLVEMLVAPV